MSHAALPINRRDFVRGAACAGLATSCLAVTASASAEESTSGATFADTIAWNAEYDVVVIGFGGAGGISSIYAADAGASVLLCDVAPEGNEGGNTRYAAQMMVGGSDPEMIYAYYKDGLAWHYDIDEETLRTYTDGLYDMPNLIEYLGVNPDDIYSWEPYDVNVAPEYPECDGADTIKEWFVHEGIWDSALWQTIRQNVVDRSDKIDVWLESPAKHLIQDPYSNAVIGVEIEREGQSVLVHARNGVVLSCGGFENNPQMIQDHIGAARLIPFGSLYNRGDGIRMALEVGADLWHMCQYESLGILNGNAWAVEDGERLRYESSDYKEYCRGSIFMVGDDGSRFMNEDIEHRHGHIYSCGVWRMPVANWAPHLIFDETQHQVLVEAGRIDDEREAKLVSADSIEELAELIGADPEILAQTYEDFNHFAETGRDYAFGRSADSMRTFDGGKIYAAEFRPGILNTQGGARRNQDAQIVNASGEPIPHLYSAGEFGGITVFQYNSGGNLGECMVFGKIAGTNAAAEKDPLPAVPAAVAAEPNILFEQGAVNDIVKSEVATDLADNEYLGTAAGLGGDLTVKVTYSDGTIQAVEVVSENETPEIGGAALPTLIDEVVSTGSTEVDSVAGASITSRAFLAAVDEAIAQAQ